MILKIDHMISPYEIHKKLGMICASCKNSQAIGAGEWEFYCKKLDRQFNRVFGCTCFERRERK
jgi:hypothetical protein